MQTVTVSPKFQVVIPLAVRERLKIVAGVKMQLLQFDNRVVFIPVQPVSALHGPLRGIDATVTRDSDRM